MSLSKDGDRPEHGVVAFVHPGLPPDLMERAAEAAAALGAELRIMPPPPSPDPGLAALVPQDLTDPPMVLTSIAAIRQDARRPLRRALRELGVDPREVRILAGVGGSGRTTLALSIYSVPGVSAEVLGEAFESVVAKRRSSTWTRRHIAGRDVRWVDMSEFSNAFWARDGLVVHVGGAPAEIERVIPLLP